jgi:tetratricopeptide (TPR) repeat protein
MPQPLHLTLTDYLDATRWRWVLHDNRNQFLADHNVQLDRTTREYGGFRDLSTYLDYNEPIHPPEKQLEELGAWIGEKVFGGLREKLWAKRARPAVAVQVVVPPAAKDLLSRPFELARFADGTSFQKAGIRFVYGLEGPPPGAVDKEPVKKALRILAAFSLPVRANPLNLRRERCGLQKLIRELNQTQGLAVELRILQYGATRETLQEAIEEAEGWDIIHLSGHGKEGELLLENDRGGSDSIDADELGELLDLSRSRLKLLILDACYSGVGSQADAREQVGLDRLATRQEGAEGETVPETAGTALPSLAELLSQSLDCAALAMRYPVGDAFATQLMLALYGKLLEFHQPLPGALQLALDAALTSDILRPPLSSITPILVGLRGTDLQLSPPPQETGEFVLPKVGLGIAFPPEPERFVGRLQPMLRASQALALRSPKRGVLFHGMPGAGKTSCALELAYRHEERRFQGYIWHRAPEAGSDISNALFNLMQDIQTQLNAPDLGLTTALDQPDRFRQFTVPRLRAMLKEKSLLVVLDNLETLLTDSDHWRDPLWVDVMAALLAHDGPSRVVLTSRRVPADLENHPKVQVEAIHALSFAESVLLSRELPNLKTLFDDEAGRTLLQQTLRVVQGHPKLLELADGLAADRKTLTERVTVAADELADRSDVLEAFFAVDGIHEGETRQQDADFVRALQGWTAGVASMLTPTARLLFAFLCRVEPVDRRLNILKANWKDFLTRLGEGHSIAVAAMAEPEQGLPAALSALESVGLVGVERPAIDPEQVEAQATTYTIHPGVAESERAAADSFVLDAADVELGNYFIAVVQHGLKTEMEGGGRMVVDSARRAAPYLLRQERWEEASRQLEQMVFRDKSPESLAFALALLRRIVEATAGTERALIDASRLARTLADAGRIAEAEPMERDVIARAVAQGNYKMASILAGDLRNLLLRRGRLEEALKVAEETAGYTKQARLGPWSQLAEETGRLQVLAAMGRNDEVLTAVEALRPKMDALPPKDETDQSAYPWNVREGLLETGREAARNTQRWETALSLNAEVVKVKRSRGADELEVARARFNDYFPLLRLGRYDEARKLLLNCRIVFEAVRHIEGLGAVYSALADLEDQTGGRAAAVRFVEVALGYSYQAGQPEACAKSHSNLANYSRRQGADPATVQAHYLAAAAIGLLTRSGLLTTRVKNLANSDLPPTPPTFAEVVQCVESIEGVRFQELFERLPRAMPDGDAAIAAVWNLVADEKRFWAEALEPLLQAIADAVNDEESRAQIEPLLAVVEQRGWRLTDAVHRIWAGERDAAALTAGLGQQDSALVRRVLDILKP